MHVSSALNERQSLDTSVSLLARALSARSLELENGSVIRLDNSNIYLFDRGQVDLFATIGPFDAPCSPRLYLGTTGGVLFGFGAYTNENRVSVCAIAVGSCKLYSIEGAVPFQKIAGGDGFARVVDEWLEGLSKFGHSEGVPTYVNRLSANARLEDGCAVCSFKCVGWVDSDAGMTLKLFGKIECAPGKVTLPLTSKIWATCHGVVDVKFLSTEDLLKCGGLRDALGQFSSMYRLHLADVIRRVNADTLERARRHAEFESRIFEDALWHIGNAFLPGQGSLSRSSDADELFWASSAVASASGMNLKKPTTGNGGDLSFDQQLGAIAEASRLRFRQVSLRGAWWREGGGHFLGLEKHTGRPVALIERRSGYVALRHGQRPIAVGATTSEDLESVAFRFYSRFHDDLVGIKEFLRIGIQGCLWSIVHACIVALAVALLGVLLPVLTQQIFDSVIPTGAYGRLVEYTLILLIAPFTGAILIVSQGIFVQRIRGRMNENLQGALWDRLLRLPLAFFRNYTAGDLTSRAVAANSIFNVLTSPVFATIFSGIFSVVNVVVMLMYDWRLALCVLLLTATMAAAAAVVLIGQLHFQRAALERQGILSGQVFQVLLAIGKLRVAAAEKRVFAEWAREYVKQVQYSYKSKALTHIVVTITASSSSVILCVVFLMAASVNPKPLTGSFLGFIVAAQQFLIGFLGLINAASACAGVLPLYRRAQPILQSPTEDADLKASPRELTGSIRLEALTFKYAGDAPLVLDGLNLTVQSGEFLAICGPSGSGKSTLLRLLLGFEKPNEGAIIYDDQRLENLDLRAVRQQIGAVLQDSRLMPGDILQNIRGTGAYSLDDVWEAARQAGIDDEIRAMPQQLGTAVAEGAGTLSGGQRQRILIARALIKRPRIMFLDEATSALDNRTQAIVTKSLESLNVTRLVVAHRLSTVVRADRIIVLERGRIVQAGTYHELVREPGLFSTLVQWQLL